MKIDIKVKCSGHDFCFTCHSFDEGIWFLQTFSLDSKDNVLNLAKAYHTTVDMDLLRSCMK